MTQTSHVDTISASSNSSPSAATSNQTQQRFSAQKIYLKNHSLEIMTPVYQVKQWPPKIDMEVRTHFEAIISDIEGQYEAALHLIITAKQQEQFLFIAKIQQAGLFIIQGFDDAARETILNGPCMNILYPYVGAAFNNMLTASGFPQVQLSLMNFEALYHQRKIQGQAQQQVDTSSQTSAQAVV